LGAEFAPATLLGLYLNMCFIDVIVELLHEKTAKIAFIAFELHRYETMRFTIVPFETVVRISAEIAPRLMAAALRKLRHDHILVDGIGICARLHLWMRLVDVTSEMRHDN
jgi:hypothetical protein